MIDKIGRAALFAKSHFTTALNSAKELTGKSIYKARGIKNKVVATNAKIKKEFSVRKDSWAKDFAGEVRREGRLVRKTVNLKSVGGKIYDYPITSGVAGGLVLRGFTSKKEKKNKKEGY
jgi:hypothetical protein